MKTLAVIVLILGALVCTGLALRDTSTLAGTGSKEVVIDLGSIPLGRQVIEGQFTVSNDRDTPIEVTGLDAGCGCLAEWEGDSVIPPGGSATYTIRFDRSMLPRGEVKRRVVIKTNSKSDDGPIGTIFRMHIPPATTESQFTVWPSVIDIGRIQAGTDTKIDQVIHAFVPGVMAVPGVTPDIELDHPLWLTVDRMDDGLEARRGEVDGLIVRFRLFASGPWPSGDFDDEVLLSLHLSDPEAIPIRHAVVVRGEVLSGSEITPDALSGTPRG